MRSKGFIVVAVMSLVLTGSAPVGARNVPSTTCRVFPANNVWHLNVSKMPLHPKGDIWKRSMHARGTDLHPDFGPPSYGMPFDVVDAGDPDVRVRFTYPSESDTGPYPFGASTAIEGGSDRHALMIDRRDCTLYELWNARWNDGRPTAGSGAVFPLEGPVANRLRPAGWTPTPPDSRCSRGCSATTRSPPAKSTTRSASRGRAPRRSTCGRPATRPRPAAGGARRWAPVSVSRSASRSRGSAPTRGSSSAR